MSSSAVAEPTSSASASAAPSSARLPAPCPVLLDSPLAPEPSVTAYSTNGYIGRTLHLRREEEGTEHCIVVAWPPGEVNSAGKKSRVGRLIDAAWFRMIENTLARIPLSHAQALHRVIIDNQPRLHGLAAFNRGLPDDGRDGHTIWLNEHLFVDRDHWVKANVGSYYSYHSNEPGMRFEGLPADHDLFSPVLLHEIGHLVMYNLVNAGGEENATPPCATSCGDLEAGCKGLLAPEQERNCISPYCRPFGFPGSTENWAELYRFYYQSHSSRALLGKANAPCLAVLRAHDEWGLRDPNAWPFGLPDSEEFFSSRWDSCGGRACKGW